MTLNNTDYSIRIMYLRMRKSMFLAFSDVIDAFVVAGKR